MTEGPQEDTPSSQPQEDTPQQEKKESLADQQGSPSPNPAAVASPKGFMYILLWLTSLICFALFASTPHYVEESAFHALLVLNVFVWLWCFMGLLILIISPLIAKFLVVVRIIEAGILGVFLFWGFINGIVAAVRCGKQQWNVWGYVICYYWKEAVAGIVFHWFGFVLTAVIALFTLYQFAVLDKKE